MATRPPSPSGFPDTLRDAAKEAAALKGTSLSAYVRESLIKELTNGR